jgi:hypothetical protein
MSNICAVSMKYLHRNRSHSKDRFNLILGIMVMEEG